MSTEQKTARSWPTYQLAFENADKTFTDAEYVEELCREIRRLTPPPAMVEDEA
jgi:hypothetical protein